MSDVVAALLLTLAAKNAGNMHALVEALRTERDAWREEALKKPGQSMV